MAYIKHNDKRVNLEEVASYKPTSDNGIEFMHAGSPTTWSFDGASARDAVLTQLDDMVNMKKIKIKKGYIGGVVDAQVIT